MSEARLYRYLTDGRPRCHFMLCLNLYRIDENQKIHVKVKVVTDIEIGRIKEMTAPRILVNNTITKLSIFCLVFSLKYFKILSFLAIYVLNGQLVSISIH